MVPVGGARDVLLVNGTGLTVSSTSPGIADVTLHGATNPAQPGEVGLQIKGKMEGRSFIEARHGRQVVKRLEVSVKPLITIRISFHFVSDKANHSTNRKPGELDDMIDILNDIFTAQTNINFKLKDYFLLNFNRDLGDAVNYNMNYQTGLPMKGHEFDLVVSKRDSSAHINVFFVWKNKFIEKTAEGTQTNDRVLGYSVGGRDILIQDWDGFMDRNNDGVADNTPAWENARMLAHEIGHVLGIADVTKTKKVKSPTTHHYKRIAVNANYVLGSGPFIPKNHANIMSAIAKQIAGK